ncbi:hypothetical protein QTP88_017441 [Uroleucon formosanum]
MTICATPDFDILNVNASCLKANPVANQKKVEKFERYLSKGKKKVTKSRSGNSQEGAEVYTGKWNYFNLMNFLHDTTTPQKTDNNISDDESEKEYTEENSEALENNINDYFNDSQEYTSSPIDVIGFENVSSVSQSGNSNCTNEISERTSNSGNVRSIKRKKNDSKAFEDELLKIETEKLNALLQSNTATTHIDDDDMLFLKSLHPYFKTMHPIQMLRLRNQIQSVIINELSITQVQPTYDTPTYNMPTFNTPTYNTIHIDDAQRETPAHLTSCPFDLNNIPNSNFNSTL